MLHSQKLLSFPKKALLLGVMLILVNVLPSQAAEVSKECDLHFSNGVTLKAVPTVETQALRRKGLSNRKSAGVGMWFVYPDVGIRVFWMHQTWIPLTAGFLDANGVIINLAHMKPNTDTLHRSTKPAKTILELAEGEFEKYGLKKGIRLVMTVCRQEVND